VPRLAVVGSVDDGQELAKLGRHGSL
jgi:hypothetical protein